ncbi:hypothetical protein NDN08_007623 [Rhodosorus marinus]|uniref:ATP-binding protein n=1 Tax=Rhodosorus marinus TaxID=101924 RepID=A0AAV8V2Y5_9RHOD|nr:hypothetical protein NDN08_007623 [Rhodosorus marinus]
MAPYTRVMFRDRNVEDLIDLLMQGENVVIHGKAGVGKRTIFDETVRKLNLPVVEVDLASLVRECSSCEGFAARIEERIDFAEEEKAILYIPEVEMLKIIEDGCSQSLFGSDNGEAQRLFGMLCDRVGRGNFQCVVTTSAYSFLNRVSAFSARFAGMVLSEMSPEQTITALTVNKEWLHERIGVDVDYKTIVAAVQLTDMYFPRQTLPAKAVEFMEEVTNTYGHCNVRVVVEQMSETICISEDRLAAEINHTTPSDMKDCRYLVRETAALSSNPKQC